MKGKIQLSPHVVMKPFLSYKAFAIFSFQLDFVLLFEVTMIDMYTNVDYTKTSTLYG